MLRNPQGWQGRSDAVWLQTSDMKKISIL